MASFEVLPWNIPEGTEESHKNPSQSEKKKLGEHLTFQRS